MRRLVTLALLLIVASPASAAAPTRAFTVPGRLAALALDGSRVAYGVEPIGAGCRSVWVWDLAKGTRTQVSGRATCAIPRTSTGLGLSELASSDGMVAWIVQTGGNTEQAETLFVSARGSKERVLAYARRTGEVDGSLFGGALSGKWLGHLVTDRAGPMFLNSWTTDGATIENAIIRAVRLTGTVRYRSGEDTLFLRSASPGWQVSVGDDETVHTFSGSRRFAAQLRGLRALALDEDKLVLLRRPATLEIRRPDDLTTTLASFPAPPGPVMGLGVANGIAVFAIGRVLYAESETTGKLAVLARGAHAWRFVALDSRALVYAGSQTIHVMPFRVVRAAVA